jgi:hypothetical protein
MSITNLNRIYNKYTRTPKLYERTGPKGNYVGFSTYCLCNITASCSDWHFQLEMSVVEEAELQMLQFICKTLTGHDQRDFDGKNKNHTMI